jgi:hypothetical protein
MFWRGYGSFKVGRTYKNTIYFVGAYGIRPGGNINIFGYCNEGASIAPLRKTDIKRYIGNFSIPKGLQSDFIWSKVSMDLE